MTDKLLSQPYNTVIKSILCTSILSIPYTLDITFFYIRPPAGATVHNPVYPTYQTQKQIC